MRGFIWLVCVGCTQPVWLPDAPDIVASDGAAFGWQSMQTNFHDVGGDSCRGQVTIAVGDGGAICYEGADDQLYCRGTVYMRDYGSAFVPAGIDHVDQVFLFPTQSGTVVGESMCVHQTSSNFVQCSGVNSTDGIFGNGTAAVSNAWTIFGQGPYAHMATSWTQMCALDDAGSVWCAGTGFGSTPVLVGSDARWFWVDSTGAAHLDDLGVLRDGVPCAVRADGLVCGTADALGTAGLVVDGTQTQAQTCWLESTGKVWCANTSTLEPNPDPGAPIQVLVNAGPMVALAGSWILTSVCAVGTDGSLWCTDATTADATQVRPPGSVKTGC